MSYFMTTIFFEQKYTEVEAIPGHNYSLSI